MKGILVLMYAGMFVVIIATIWTAGVSFADATSELEVVSPIENVECAVVSRMFNTSVDCWRTDEQ